MYSYTIWNPASSLAITSEVYSHFLSVFCRRSRPVNRRATWSWNPPRTLPMQGVTAQFSKPKSNTTCTTDLKKNQDTRGSALSLMSILFILFHTALAHD